MKKTIMILSLVLISLVALSCDFKLEVETTQISEGEEFYIRVTIIKDHNKCVLTSMDDYKFDADGLELLGMTGWQEISGNTFQTWVKAKAIESGEGYFKIWKNCSKEGYDEEVLLLEIS